MLKVDASLKWLLVFPFVLSFQVRASECDLDLGMNFSGPFADHSRKMQFGMILTELLERHPMSYSFPKYETPNNGYPGYGRRGPQAEKVCEEMSAGDCVLETLECGAVFYEDRSLLPPEGAGALPPGRNMLYASARFPLASALRSKFAVGTLKFIQEKQLLDLTQEFPGKRNLAHFAYAMSTDSEILNYLDSLQIDREKSDDRGKMPIHYLLESLRTGTVALSPVMQGELEQHLDLLNEEESEIYDVMMNESKFFEKQLIDETVFEGNWLGKLRYNSDMQKITEDFTFNVDVTYGVLLANRTESFSGAALKNIVKQDVANRGDETKAYFNLKEATNESSPFHRTIKFSVNAFADGGTYDRSFPRDDEHDRADVAYRIHGSMKIPSCNDSPERPCKNPTVNVNLMWQQLCRNDGNSPLVTVRQGSKVHTLGGDLKTFVALDRSKGDISVSFNAKATHWAYGAGARSGCETKGVSLNVSLNPLLLDPAELANSDFDLPSFIGQKMAFMNSLMPNAIFRPVMRIHGLGFGSSHFSDVGRWDGFFENLALAGYFNEKELAESKRSKELFERRYEEVYRYMAGLRWLLDHAAELKLPSNLIMQFDMSLKWASKMSFQYFRPRVEERFLTLKRVFESDDLSQINRSLVELLDMAVINVPQAVDSLNRIENHADASEGLKVEAEILREEIQRLATGAEVSLELIEEFKSRYLDKLSALSAELNTLMQEYAQFQLIEE